MYYLVFFIGTIFLFQKKNENIKALVFLFIIAGMAIFRYGVGPDYFSYKGLYGQLNANIIKEFMEGIGYEEIFFRLIGSLLKKLGFSYQQYLGFISIINIYFVGKFCKKNSVNYIFSVFIYYAFFYFTWTFGIIRQGLTVSIGIYYYIESLKKHQNIKFCFIVILLSFIHSSTLAMIPLYFISKLKWNKWKLLIFSSFCILSSFLPLNFLVSKMANVALMNRIALYYVDSSFFANILSFKVVARLIFLIVSIGLYDVYTEKKEIDEKIMNTFIISLSVYFVLRFSEITASRIAIYGFIFSIIIFPKLYYSFKVGISRKVYNVLLYSICILYFQKELLTMMNLSDIFLEKIIIVPYTNIYNEERFKNNF